jgi:Arc/MetJ-type ribon-helix-helix transcriptional regulator
MTVKIGVSLPDKTLAIARRAVQEGRADSVSGFIVAAIGRAETQDNLAALIADMKREWGEPSPQDYAWADAQLGSS